MSSQTETETEIETTTKTTTSKQIQMQKSNSIVEESAMSQQQQQQQQKEKQENVDLLQQNKNKNNAEERIQQQPLIIQRMGPASRPQFSHSVPLNAKTLTATVAMVVDDDGGNGWSGENGGGCGNEGCTTLQRAQWKQQQQQQRGQTAQKLYAKAIYDNIADRPDELAFKKGDILTVIEQDTDGLVGWWLCVLRNRTGLCAGNRLRILNSYDSGCFLPTPPPSPCPSLAASTTTLNSSICSAEIYENSSIISSASNNSGNNITNNNQQQQSWQQQQQRQGTRRSWHASPNKVIIPQRHGDVYLYNCQLSTGSYNLQHLQRQSAVLQPQQSPHQKHQQPQLQIYSNQSIYQNRSMMSAASTNGGSNMNSEFETYDVPKPATPVNYDCPKNVVCRTPTSIPTAAASFRLDPISLTMKPIGGGCSTPIQDESYDIPRPLTSLMHNTMTPSSSNSSLQTSDSLSLSFSSSNRSSLANMPDYDVPRRNPLPVRAVQQNLIASTGAVHHQSHQQLFPHQRHPQQLISNTNCMTYDFPMPSCSSSAQSTPLQENSPQQLAAATKELPLEFSSALETLAKLQSEATTAIARLLSYVSPDWRLREKLEPVIMDIKLAAVRLRTALHDLTEFGEGALGNATRSEDRSLALKLRPLVRALRDADKLINESCEALDVQGGWTVEKLSRNDDKSMRKPPDSLDQLIACVQRLIEDVRQTTSFIQGNASLLFKRSPLESISEQSRTKPTHTQVEPSTPDVTNGSGNNATSSDWLEDNDYVSFESKDAVAKKNLALREAIQHNMKKKFDMVLKAAETTAITNAPGAASASATASSGPGATATASKPLHFIDNINKNDELNENDKHIIHYYAMQITTNMGHLRQAIDSFLETVEKNQPPKYFIAYGKFVVVSAYNLVMTGDTVHRNLSKADLGEKILTCSNALSEALKTCVTKSKKASAHFPSVTAVQEMVDSVVDISHLASDLERAMLHAVQISVM